MDLNIPDEVAERITEAGREDRHQQYLSEAEAAFEVVDETPAPSLEQMIRAAMLASRAAMYLPSRCRFTPADSALSLWEEAERAWAAREAGRLDSERPDWFRSPSVGWSPDLIAEASRRRTAEAKAAATPATRRPGYDRNPTLLNVTDPNAYARYALGLDNTHPGWHHDDLRQMAPELAVQARVRRWRERVQAAPSSEDGAA